MRLVCAWALGGLLSAAALAGQTGIANLARIADADLDQRYLLQINYEVWDQNGVREFATSRSRIVRFLRQDAVVLMRDEAAPNAGSAEASVLARIPFHREAPGVLALDLNAGFDRISADEDRTGQDYYERSDQQDAAAILLRDRKAISMVRHGDTLALDQSATKDDGSRVVAHYYLRPYRPVSGFRAFEMKNLDHFGFYETYPVLRSNRSMFYAMKFDASRPIVFALSSAIPERHRDAVRDGILYWNRALGQPLITAVDAPSGVRAPSVDYNIVEWVPAGPRGSTTHIQGDPLTGQILHAHVFVRRELTMDGQLDAQNDQLRFFVAHEIGHALGLRHNFEQGSTTTTVMDYFKRPQEIAIGRDIRAGTPALGYDRDVMRHVYLGAPLSVGSLPPFCTDAQPGCVPSAARDDRR